MKFLFPLICFSLLFFSCATGEELFIQAVSADSESGLLLLIETVELHKAPWDREALLMLSSYPSENWAMKHYKKIYSRGERDEEFLSSYSRMLFLAQKEKTLHSLLEDSEDFSGKSLYLRLVSDSKISQSEIILMSGEEILELSLIQEENGMVSGVPLMILDYRRALLFREYGQASRIFDLLLNQAPRWAMDRELLYWGWYGLALQEDWELHCETLALSEELDSRQAFVLGRIYRYHNQWETAQGYFQLSEGDRSLWYALDCAFQIDPVEAAYQILGILEQLEDPAYFDDKLQRALTEILKLRDWESVSPLATFLWEHKEESVSSRCYWVLARLQERGYLSSAPFTPDELYQEILERNPLSWYGFLAGRASGQDSAVLEQLPQGDIEFRDSVQPLLEGNSEEARDFRNSADWVLIRLIQRGLNEQALEFLSRRGNSLGLYSAPFVQSLMLREERYYQSIHYALDSRSMEGYEQNLMSLKYLHPYVYVDEVRNNCETYGIEPWLLHGLIRIESAYDRSIVSRSGAVGLGQLMKATAEEQALYLGLDQPDLTDPETNLLISTRYIDWLMNRPYVENWGDMLIAYNGGPGSLQRWKRTWGDLPPEIFWELIPYSQSREYLPKVFTAAMIYGYLYGDTEPDRLLDLWVPDLFFFEPQ